MLVVGPPPCRSLVALISDPKSEWLALTSNYERNTSNIMSERHNTYIHQHDSTQLLSSVKRLSTHIWPWLVRKEQHSHPPVFQYTTTIICGKEQQSHPPAWQYTTTIICGKEQHLYSTMRGTNPAYMSKGLSTPGWGFLVTDQVAPFF